MEKKEIKSRGVPSKFSLYLPPHYSEEIRSFESNETPTMNIWKLEEIVNFVFSKKYQPTSYEIAYHFLKELGEKVRMDSKEIAGFIKEKGISKATFYNKILPKLKRVGMIKVEREATETGNSKKYRMKISLSKTFGNYLGKISTSWLAFVDDARTRNK